jgi:hypothetical protein
MVPTPTVNGEKTMRTILTISSLGLTLALGLGTAALAAPGDRYALQSRDSAIEQNRNHYLHKKYYRHDQDRARGEGSGTTRLPDRDGVGTANPDVRKPVIGPEPVVRG